MERNTFDRDDMARKNIYYLAFYTEIADLLDERIAIQPQSHRGKPVYDRIQPFMPHLGDRLCPTETYHVGR